MRQNVKTVQVYRYRFYYMRPSLSFRSLEEPKADALLQPPDDGALMASYSVFVLVKKTDKALYVMEPFK